MKIRLLLAFLLMSFCVILAQNNVIDSLENILIEQKEDTNKVKILNAIGWEHININPKKAIDYENEALLLSEKLNYKSGIAISKTHLGYIAVSSGNYNRALENYKSSLEIFIKINDKQREAVSYTNIANAYFYLSDYLKNIEYNELALDINKSLNNLSGIASNYNSLGNAYLKLGNYPKTLNYFIKSLNIYEKQKQTKQFAGCYNNIAIVYKKQNDYENALKYYNKAIEIHKKANNQKGLAECYNNIGVIYEEENKNTKANDYYNKALNIFNEIGYKKGIAVVTGNIGEVYFNEKNYIKTLEYYNLALKMQDEIGDIENVASTSNRIAKTYIKLSKYDKAKKHVFKSLDISEKIGSLFQKNISYKLLVQIYETEHNYSKAYYYSNLFIVSSDSLFGIEKTKEIENIKNQYALDKKEAEIQALSQQTEILKKENQIQELQINKNKYLLISIVGISVLLILLSVLLINRQRIKSKKDKLINIAQKALMDAEMKNINLEKEKLNSELLFRKKEVANLATQIIEKNNLIEDIEEKIKKVKENKNSLAINGLNEINIDLNLNKTREDFYVQVEQLHKDFFLKISRKYSNLTKNEKKLAALLRMELTSKDISTLMNISPKSVDMNRYRLRKKLNIDNETNLVKFLKIT